MFPFSRYELEYDEKRLEIGKEIGRRFLGFELKEDVPTTTTTTKNSLVEAESPPAKDGGGGGDNLNNCLANNSSTTLAIDKENFGGHDLLDIGEKEQLVLDVLNDDEVERVREKIFSGSKDLFESCQSAVKSFIAGEPFQEFEHSMYFHRYETNFEIFGEECVSNRRLFFQVLAMEVAGGTTCDLQDVQDVQSAGKRRFRGSLCLPGEWFTSTSFPVYID